jgi:rod shape-determining protein MreD
MVAGEMALGGAQAHVVRATLLVAVAALLEVTLAPLLTFGWVAPRFLILGVIVAVADLREMQALLLGFFGGILTDALSGGLFGVGALGGVFAAAISLRIRVVRRKVGAGPFAAQAVALAVVRSLGTLRADPRRSGRTAGRDVPRRWRGPRRAAERAARVPRGWPYT